MDSQPAVPGPSGVPEPQANAGLPPLGSISQSIKGRMLGGLLLVLPILITAWLIHWFYSGLEKYVIDPIALLVLWQIRGHENDTTLPVWFETYVAPVIAIVIALLLLYFLGFLVHSRLRRAIDWVLLRVPLVSGVYNGVRNVFQSLDRQRGQKCAQRVVLIQFPHAGMRAAAFVTATCRDVATQKTLLCVYVPQSPLPTNGHLLLVPEEEATELNWGSEQTLQTLISGGFTAPPEVNYYMTKSAIESKSAAAALTSEAQAKK